jgi:hypothetical protein
MFLQKLASKITGVLFFLIFFCFLENVYAQSYKEYVPPTPTAAALGKYVDIPVNLSTGIPEINIPIYEIKCGTLSLPISLNYHAGGFRVAEEATWVGLGWSLLAGGAITRTILDKLDPRFRDPFFNGYDGVLFDESSVYTFPTIGGHYGYDYLKWLSQGTIDGSPDLYQFNFNGKSGKFVNINGEFKLIPKQPLKIIGNQLGYSITDEQGNRYDFVAKERTKTKSSFTASNVVTSWFLTKITSPSNDSITFEYKPTEFIQDVSISETKTYSINKAGYWVDGSLTSDNYNTTLWGLELKKIKFKQGEIVFTSTYDREDLRKTQGTLGALKLNGIEVFNKEGGLIKKLGLYYDYFNKSLISENYKRLKLTALEDELTASSYGFVYEENINLPAKNSKAQDHWGYFNNRNNSSLAPELNRESNCHSGTNYFKPNREPDTTAVKANILKEIFYPTGGSTKYVFEAHDYQAAPYLNYANETIASETAAAYQNSAWGSTDYEVFSPVFNLKERQCVGLSLNIQENQIIDKYRPYVRLLRDNEGISSTPIATFYLGDNPDQYLELSPGNYFLMSYAKENGSIAIGNINYDPTLPIILSKKWAGGVRVKKIETKPLVGPEIVKLYAYTLNGEPNSSSGALLLEPDYLSNFYTYTLPPGAGSGGAGLWCVYDENQWMQVSSNSSSILGSGNHINYKEVTEYSGVQKNQGKSVLYFSVTQNINNKGDYDQGWHRGLLLEKRYYNAEGRLIEKTKNDYLVHTLNYEQFYSYNAHSIGGHPCVPANPSFLAAFPQHFSQTASTIVSAFQYLGRKIDTKYSGPDSIETLTEYYYDNKDHLQPTRIITSTSNSNEVRVATTSYPDDYADTNGFVANLKTAHIIAPIEQVDYLQDEAGNNQKILKGTVSTYKAGSFNKALKDQVWQLENDIPISLANFKFTSRALGALPNTTAKDYFLKDSRYKKVLTFDSYDKQNRPNQLTKTHEQPVAMIWSEDGEHLLAQVINARADQIFHTSFEDSGIDSATAKTGGKFHPGNFTIPNGKEPVIGSYILSYWERHGGEWKYKEQQINYQPNSGPLINSASEIDEVRLYPLGASMTTYTYKPLVGNTSVCDPNNLVTYYFYDSAGRLSHTKDDKGNVLQKYQYKYVNQ